MNLRSLNSFNRLLSTDKASLRSLTVPRFKSRWPIASATRLLPIVLMVAMAVLVYAPAYAEEEPGGLVHYWHFNDLPAGALEVVESDYSVLESGSISYPGTGDGYMDRVNEGTLLNARQDADEGRSLRIRNPSDTRELLLAVPTTGFERLHLTFAASRTSNGAEEVQLWYRENTESEWVLHAETFSPLVDVYSEYTVDFSEITEANNNADFNLRFVFVGDNAASGSGNVRFDNITIDATHINPTAHPLVQGPLFFAEWDPNLPERTYPAHGLFLQSDIDDPTLDTPLHFPYYIRHDDYHNNDEDFIGTPYNLTGRTRLNGLGKQGISFINTGRGRDLGGLLLAVDTTNIDAAYIDWLGGTVEPNNRIYAIRLQYRVGTAGDFADVLYDGQPVEYIRQTSPHHQSFTHIPIPPEALNQEYVQFLWRYYYLSGSGSRAELRLDNVYIYDEATRILDVEVAGNGSGTVNSVGSDIDCGESCLEGFLQGTQVTLQATAAPFSAFVGWTGICSDQGSICTFTIEDNQTVTAIFETTEGVVINELLASNGNIIADEDGEFGDWIELFNRGSTPIELNGIGLSDNPQQPFRWVLPDLTLEPGEFLLVWATGKDRNDPNGPLHTNFSISSQGETLLLTHPVDGLLDEIETGQGVRDISLGRKPDGGYEWFLFDQPTPGGPNIHPGYLEILAPPLFSHIGGFYTEAFELDISSDDADVTIYFTLDGSEPHPDNLTGFSYNYKQNYAQQPSHPFGELLTTTFETLL